jgi:hypothetical protein
MLHFALGLCLLTQAVRAEEEHSLIEALSSTTISGYVDTSFGVRVVVGRPANDAFVQAVPIDVTSLGTPVNLTFATLEAGEPASPLQVGSVWYKWSFTQDGVARISTNGLPAFPTPTALSTLPALSSESIFYPWGGIDYGGGAQAGYEEWRAVKGPDGPIGYQRWWTRLAAYRGNSLSTLSLVTAGDHFEFDVQAGETIWIALEVYENQPAYPGEPELPQQIPQAIYADVIVPANNDSFSSSLAVSDTSGGVMNGYALAATRESGEPDLGAEFGGGSVWFHYTAATYGTISISDISQNLPIGVFTGASVSDLKLVAKSAAGGIAFFGEEGVVYHIAVYHGANTEGFNLTYHGPQYRLYETTLAELMPNGLVPYFYGVRGRTMLLYEKTDTGWRLDEIEPIVNYGTELLIRPLNAISGKLRVITVDDEFPSPHVVLRLARGLLVPDLVGIAGQTCAVSSSSDLVNWSAPEIHTLDASRRALHAINEAHPAMFFRVTQSLPVTSGATLPVELPH